MLSEIQKPNHAFQAYKGMKTLYQNKIRFMEKELTDCEMDVSFMMVVSAGEAEFEYNTQVIPMEAFAWKAGADEKFRLMYLKGCFVSEGKTIEVRVGQTQLFKNLGSYEQTPLADANPDDLFRLGKYLMEFESKFADYIQPALEV
jgi:hypothetical protein